MPSLASHLGGQVINYEAWPAAKGLCWPAPAWGAESANSGELVRPWGRAGGPPKRATVAARGMEGGGTGRPPGRTEFSFCASGGGSLQGWRTIGILCRLTLNLMLGKLEGGRRRGRWGTRWLDGIIDSTRRT